MVLSKIDKSVNYSELKKLNEDDIDYETYVYSGNLFDKYIEFSIGKPKYAYIDKNIIFFYIYLINYDSVLINIGVYEILSYNYTNVIDEDGNIILNKLNKSLIFDYVENYIKTKYKLNKKGEERIEKSKTTEDIEIQPEKSIPDTDPKVTDLQLEQLKVTDKLEKKVTLKEQTKEDAEEEKRIYLDNEDNFWVEKYLKNNNYSQKDNEGGGDCLFAVIRDGLAGVGENMTVKEIREELVKEVDENVFNTYREKYEAFAIPYNDLQNRLKELAKRNKELSQLKKTTKLKEEQLVIVQENKLIIEEFNKLKEESNMLKELLIEFKYMKDLNTLDKFKDFIKSKDFWADGWAIPTLERILKIKLIILSKTEYENDASRTLQCGEVDQKINNEGKFEPKYYIITSYTGNIHYTLVMYKKHTAFTFKELPYSIKEAIILRCMERSAGPFNLIPEFKEFAKRFNVDEKLLAKDIELEAPTSLYSDDIIFQYYIKSNGKPYPGKGSGEKIPDNMITEFSKLNKIKDWRRKLSNYWNEDVIVISGKQWQSVEHYYQANKFKKNNPEYYDQFSLDSGSELSKNPLLAKVAGSKNGKTGSKQIRPVGINIDSGFSSIKDKILEEAIFAKFTQHDELKEILINTKNAKLMNYQTGDVPTISIQLMKVREKILS